MTFTTDVPVTGDSLGSTRDRIRGNFQQIASVFAINHVPFNATGQGKHNFLQMPEQVAAPVTLVNEAGFYSKVGINPAETNLFFRGESNGFEYQLTRAISASTTRFGNQTVYTTGFTGGWTFLPGGLIFQWGTAVAPSKSTSAFVVPFPVAFTSPAFSVTTTIQNSGSDSQDIAVVPGTILNNQFSIRNSSSSSANFFWMAVGK